MGHVSGWDINLLAWPGWNSDTERKWKIETKVRPSTGIPLPHVSKVVPLFYIAAALSSVCGRRQLPITCLTRPVSHRVPALRPTPRDVK